MEAIHPAMAVLDTTVGVLHTLFAGLWAGGVLVMAGLVLPAARNGHLTEAGLRMIAKRFTYLTLASVAVTFATGGHMAGTRYTFESLLGTERGYLVLAMLGLWFVLAGLLHVGTRGLTSNLDSGSVESAVAASSAWFNASAVVALALLVVAGLL